MTFYFVVDKTKLKVVNLTTFYPDAKKSQEELEELEREAAMITFTSDKIGVIGGESLSINAFDTETLYKNCTVQIWENSVTGDCSIGWWPNEQICE